MLINMVKIKDNKILKNNKNFKKNKNKIFQF